MTQSPRTSRLRRAVSITVAGVLGAGAFVAGTAPAQAAPGDPFDEADPTVFIVKNDRLFKALTDEDGTYRFQAEGPVAPFAYNGIGYNTADNYLYGTTRSAGAGVPVNTLIRIGQDGVIERVGTAPLPGSGCYCQGAFGPDGLLYTIGGSAGSQTRMLVVDVTTGDVVREVTLSQPTAVADYTYADGYFWGARSNTGQIVRIDPQSGEVVYLAGRVLGGTGAYGSAWTFGNGNLGFQFNPNGRVFQVQVANPGAVNPTFTIVSRSNGPGEGGGDGTSSPGLPTDFAITKTGPDTFIAGDTLTYELTVTNNGPGNSSGWVVTDELPAGLTAVDADRDSCTIDADTITCTGGRLEAGDSRTITITATAPTGATECLTNTASVLPNEEDADLSDNEATTTACPTGLTIEKESVIADGADPTITYVVTATNDTGVDYTADNPAVVMDDLSGVLDDGDLVSGPTADRAPAVSYAQPLISWTGPLPAGESVSITYQIRVDNLGETGDGEVRNIAWVPNDPDNPTPPSCDTDDGVDPITGEPCDTDTIIVEDIPLTDPAITAMAGLLGLGLAGGLTLHRRRHRAATSAG